MFAGECFGCGCLVCLVGGVGGATSSPEYHWRSVLCILVIVGGVRRSRKS